MGEGKGVRVVEWVEPTWAVATLAISEAVGCWICCSKVKVIIICEIMGVQPNIYSTILTISWSKTLPSLVSLMSPAPDTSLGGRV